MTDNEREIDMTTLGDYDTIEMLYSKLRTDDPFYYLRYGDGDLLIMSDPEYNRESYHTQSPRFRYELLASYLIRDDNYLIGSVEGTQTFHYNDKLDRISKEIAGDSPSYLSAMALHRAYYDLESPWNFLDFCSLFQSKKVLFIGGESVCTPVTRACFNADRFIVFPDQDAYYHLEDKIGEIKAALDEYTTVVAGIGLATRVLGARLWSAGFRHIQYFDVGSPIDAIVGKRTRKWIKACKPVTKMYQKEIENGRFGPVTGV